MGQRWGFCMAQVHCCKVRKAQECWVRFLVNWEGKRCKSAPKPYLGSKKWACFLDILKTFRRSLNNCKVWRMTLLSPMQVTL